MPENLATKCPGCGTGYRLKDASAAGKKMKCRQCAQVFVIQPAGAKKPEPQPDEFGDFDAGEFDDFGPTSGTDDLAAPVRKTGGASKSKTKRKPDARKKPRKKSKRRSDEEKGGMSPITIAGGIGVLLVLVIAGGILLKPGKAPAIEPPTSYSQFTHPINNIFTCEYPSDWEAKNGGQVGSVIWAQFETQKAKIEIRRPASGGALGDIFGGASPQRDAPDDLTPVARLHDHRISRDPVADNFSDYEEQQARTIKTNMGDGRISQFSASGSWGKKLSGFRATIIGGGGRQLNVVASCPESDWEVCKPVFERIISSIR